MRCEQLNYFQPKLSSSSLRIFQLDKKRAKEKFLEEAFYSALTLGLPFKLLSVFLFFLFSVFLSFLHSFLSSAFIMYWFLLLYLSFIYFLLVLMLYLKVFLKLSDLSLSFSFFPASVGKGPKSLLRSVITHWGRIWPIRDFFCSLVVVVVFFLFSKTKS